MTDLNRIKDNIRKIVAVPKTTELRGAHFPDPFLRYIKGFTAKEKAARDGMSVYVEVDRIVNAIFPVLKKPASRPGYVTYTHDYFQIEYSGQKIRADLENYFLDEHRRWETDLYGGARNLAGLFEFICRQILIDGVAYYAFKWIKTKVKNKNYYMPDGFQYLDPSTIKAKHENSQIKKFKQRYSIWTILTSSYFDFKNRDFKRDQVIFVKYPFSKSSPVQNSLKFLPQIKAFWKFSLDHGQSSVEPQNHSLDVEKARYKVVQDERRKQCLARAKIRREFRYLYENVNLTSYYDVYTVVRYRKFLNDIRNFLVDQFNEQVLKQLSLKNKLKGTPKIVIKKGLFIDNATIDTYFNQFKNRQVSIDDFVERVIKKN